MIKGNLVFSTKSDYLWRILDLWCLRRRDLKSSDGPRIGEDGALGWSTWLEKEEEQRQRIVREDVLGICS
ncbi:hypothetical protein ACS0TY_001479 [Phlomoides rotata]